MTKRKAIGKKLRFEVFKRDGFKCQYCGASAPEAILHVDHIKPVAAEGTNDILNLVTACQPCNAGKGKRELSDDSAVKKQMAQLDELSVRREQLDMLLEWRDGLAGITDDMNAAAVDAFNSWLPDSDLSLHGEKKIHRLVKRFELAELLDAIDTSCEQYLRFDGYGNCTEESVTRALSKLPAIIKNKDQDPDEAKLYYIRGILRNRLSYINEPQAFEFLKSAYDHGTPLDELQAFSKEVSSWTRFKEQVHQWVEEGSSA
jgi:hypothetical protein